MGLGMHPAILHPRRSRIAPTGDLPFYTRLFRRLITCATGRNVVSPPTRLRRHGETGQALSSVPGLPAADPARPALPALPAPAVKHLYHLGLYAISC